MAVLSYGHVGGVRFETRLVKWLLGLRFFMFFFSDFVQLNRVFA